MGVWSVDGEGKSFSADRGSDSSEFSQRWSSITFCFCLYHRRVFWFAFSARRSRLWIFPGMGIGLRYFLVVSRTDDDDAALARAHAGLVLSTRSAIVRIPRRTYRVRADCRPYLRYRWSTLGCFVY